MAASRVVPRLFRIVGHRIALLLQLLDGGLQLRNRRADVRQLDDVRVGVLASSPSSARSSGRRLSAAVRPESWQGCVPRARCRAFHHDASRAREGLDDGQERVGGEGGRFVGVRVDDRGCHRRLIFLHLRIRKSRRERFHRRNEATEGTEFLDHEGHEEHGRRPCDWPPGGLHRCTRSQHTNRTAANGGL